MSGQLAAWTLNPISERNHSEERRSRLAVRRSGCLLSSFAFLILPFLFLPQAPVVPMLGIVALLVLAFNFLRRSGRAEERRMGLRRALLEEFGDVPGWIVDLTIYQGNCPTGQDRGIVWFENDQLIFTGNRTSFILEAPTAAQAPVRGSRLEDVRSSVNLELKSSRLGLPVSLGFDYVSSEPGVDRSLEFIESLTTTLKDWISKGVTVESQPPPLNIGPDVPSATQLFHRALLASIYWILAFGLGAMLAFLPLFCAAILALLLPEVRLPIRRCRAYLDRMRLERGKK